MFYVNNQRSHHEFFVLFCFSEFFIGLRCHQILAHVDLQYNPATVRDGLARHLPVHGGEREYRPGRGRSRHAEEHSATVRQI